MVRSKHVRTFLKITLSQESESEVSVQEICAAIRIMTRLDLSMSDELVTAETPAEKEESYFSVLIFVMLACWLL